MREECLKAGKSALVTTCDEKFSAWGIRFGGSRQGWEERQGKAGKAKSGIDMKV